MDLTVANVYGLLLRSKLLSIDETRAMFARWQDEAREDAQNTARFAQWMVGKGYLTEYQAGLLARGHAEGFFLNEYKILDRLGKGRMAGVYKAQHPTGQVVAIKVLPPSKAKDPMLFARFQRESRLALRFKHPNIVRSYQVGVAEGLHYLVMEYLEGETLEEVLVRRKRFRPDEAVHLIHQALQGLGHIHEQKVVHRDLKPANIMLVPAAGQSGEILRCMVKLLDIGLGRSLFEDAGAEAAFDQGLTGEGVMLGTPDYMAPEQARDARGIDIRADIYSLGCVLYHLLTGQPPFPDTNIISQMIRHATEVPRPLLQLNPDVPEGIQQIVNWMMAKEPSGRYATPERAAQALQLYLVAGQRPAVGVDGDPGMQPFLNWLENQSSGDGPAQQPIPLAMPVLPQTGRRPEEMATVPGLQVNDSAAPVRPSEEARRKKNKATAKLTVPPPLPAVESEELSPDLKPGSTAPVTGRLARRDLLLFGFGVLCGAVATFLGCLFALRSRF